MARKLMVAFALVVIVGLIAACTGTPQVTPTAARPAGSTPEAAKPASPTPAPAVKRGGTLKVGVVTDYTTFDPHTYVLLVEGQILPSIAGGLLKYSKDAMQLQPVLASSWEVGSDGLSITFKLRPGAKFHDGTPFNAAAVKANMQRQLDPATKSRNLQFLTSIKSVDVIDDLTVRFNLSSPDAALVSHMALSSGWMVSPAAIQKYNNDLSKSPIGAGAFQYVEWVKGDHLTLKRFEDYWDKDAQGNKMPFVDEIILKPIPDDTVRLVNLKGGTVDIIEVPAVKDAASIKESKDLVYGAAPPHACTMLRMNVTKPPFNDVNLRRAVAWAIDRAAINKTVYMGTSEPAVSPLLGWAHDANVGFGFDQAKAKQYLSAAGKQSGFKFVLDTRAEPLFQSEAQLLKFQWSQVGIDAELKTMDTPTLTANLRNKTYEASHSTYCNWADPDNQLSIHFDSRSQINFAGYSNPKVDELLAKGKATYKQDERTAVYRELEKILIDEVPQIQMVRQPSDAAWSTKVQGFEPRTDRWFSFEGVWLK